jgi:eukaryotic-like serine/threonine-protein kinase
MPPFIDSDVIGTGGFGEVCKCMSGTRVYAKKKLTQHTDQGAVERFKREVRILSQLDHPNIIKVVDYHLAAQPFWYIMPMYVNSLDDTLKYGMLSDARIEKVFRAILDGVEYAHAEGVIHRDLKPANVLLNNDDDVVVSDFGLGRMLDAESTRQTLSGYGMGSVFFMAPEQTNNVKNADERSDVFALGRILYCLYTGPVTSLYANLTSLKPNVRAIVNKSTQQEPEKRFQSVAEFKKAWLASTGSLTTSESTAKKLEQLINELTTGITTINKEDTEKVVELLLECMDDKDYLHQIIMEVPNEVIALASFCVYSDTQHIIKMFVEFTSAQSYTFSYTDKIGDKCAKLYSLIDDFDIRAELLFCLIEVGYGHNRFYVMDQFDALLESINEPVFSLVIAEKLKHCSKYNLERAAKRISTSKLDPELIKLFR